MLLFWVDTKYACAGILTNDMGIIVETAPIYSKYKGQHLNNVLSSLHKRGLLRSWEQCK